MKTNITVSVFAAIGILALFPLSASWAANAQVQVMAASQNQGTLIEFSVPVRLTNIDRKIHSGKVICTVIDGGSSENMFGMGGMGTGNAIFSINPGDGSFNGNVKVSVVSGKNIQDSQFAKALKYACWLYLSPASNTWTRPANGATEDMYLPKLGSSLVSEVEGNIPAQK